MPLRQQAETRLGHSALVIITERVDDVALLLGPRITMGVPEVVDRHIPRPWQPRGLRWGGTAVLGLAHMLTAGEHRKVAGEVESKGMHPPLSCRTAPVIQPLDCSDDRLRHLLPHVSTPQYWPQIDRDWQDRRIEGHGLPQEVIRCAATPVAGAHAVTAEGLLQFGPSTDAPTRPQINGMRGSLDPWGMPRATEGLAGERAAAGVDLARMERIRPGLQPPGLLVVGAGPRRAWATGASRAGPHDRSWSPLPFTGATAAALDAWSSEGGRAVTRASASEVFVLMTAGTRGAPPRAMRVHGPVGRRAATRAGRHGSWSCAPPGRPTTRGRAGPNVCAMPSPPWLPCRLPEGGASDSAPRKRRS